MTKRDFRKRLMHNCVISAGIFTCLLPGSVLAVENEKYLIETVDDVIIVTARKRSEKDFETPVAVDSFLDDDIAAAGIVDLQQLSLHTPGFSYREGFGRILSEGNNRPVMRGMSSVLGEPNAAFFVDGIYIAGPVSGYDLKNLSRVEVIKGPQSALFGRGAFGGATNFVTRRPTDEFKGNLSSTVGNFSKIDTDGYISGAIAENVNAELNARYYDRGALYQNTATGEKDLGSQSSIRIGGKLDIDAGDNLNIYLTGGWSKDEDSGYAYDMWNGGDPRNEGVSDNKSNCYDPSIFMSIAGMNFTNTLSRGYYCGEITSPDNIYSDYGGLNSVERENVNVSGILTYEFDSGSTLTSLTGYTDINYSQASVPANYEGAPVVWKKGSQSYFSEEIRYSSPTDQPLRYMIGGYYFKNKQGDNVNVSFVPPEVFFESDHELLSDNSYIENKAAFFAVDYDINESFMATAELRYQDETKTLGGDVYDGEHKISFDAWLPRFALTWRPHDDATFYATIAKGNKPGGFNEHFYHANLDETDREFWRDLGRGTFDESTVWSYEAGLKSHVTENLNLNASVFYLDWRNQQLTTSDALRRVNSSRQTTVTFINNAGKSEIKGFELGADWQVTEEFKIRIGYAYNQSKFKDYLDENWRDLQDTNGWYSGQAIAAAIFPGGDITGSPSLLPDGVILDDSLAPVDSDGDGEPDRFYVVDTVDPDGQVRGKSLPQSPRHQLSMSVSYNVELTDNLQGFIRGDFLYESKRFVQAANLAYVGDNSLVNLRVGVEKERWKLTFWVNNLLKNNTPEVATRYLDMGNILMLPSQVRSGSRFTFGRDFTVTPADPRTFGMTFNYKF